MARAHTVPLPARIAFVVALVLAQLVRLPAASAQPPAEVARQLSSRAHAAYRAGNYQEALDLLGAAYRLDPRPILLYNMGRVLEATDKPSALRTYRRCLEQPECPGEARERAEALEPEVRALEQARRAAPAPTPRSSASSASSASSTPAAPPPSERAPSPWPWVVSGAGAAVLAAGIVAGAVGRARSDDAATEPAVGRSRELHDEASTLATWANVGIVAGAGLLLAGGVWGVVDLATLGGASASARGGAPASARSGATASSRPSRGWTLAVGPTSVSLRARF